MGLSGPVRDEMTGMLPRQLLAAATPLYILFTEPDQGFSQVYDLINGATSSIDMTMYELSDTTAEQDLVAAEARGVTVRVILDQREESYNEAAYTYLTDNGVGVVWSPASTFTGR
jgi:cardiolipin synthase A/B